MKVMMQYIVAKLMPLVGLLGVLSILSRPFTSITLSVNVLILLFQL